MRNGLIAALLLAESLLKAKFDWITEEYADVFERHALGLSKLESARQLKDMSR